jgi:hypothetical protein
VLFADRLEVAAEAGVADQRLVPFRQLARQRGPDRGAIGGILPPPVVAADDVAPPREDHRLSLIVDLLAALPGHISEHTGRPSPSITTARIIWSSGEDRGDDPC